MRGWRAAAARGDVDAMFSLAFAYDEGGDGVAADPGEAARWSARAEAAAAAALDGFADDGSPTKWTYRADAPVAVVGVACKDDKVFVGTQRGLVAVAAATGGERWAAPGAFWKSRPLPSGDGATVFAGTRSGAFVALDAATGGDRWRLAVGDVDSTAAASPDGRAVYFGGDDGAVRCVTAAGAELWAARTGAFVVGRPAVSRDGRAVYAGSVDSRVYAFAARDGARRWVFDTGGPVEGGPAVSADDAVVFVGSHDGRVYAVDALDGSELWRYDAGGGSRPVGGAPALSPDGAFLYVAAHRRLVALRAADGAEVWAFETGDVVEGDPVVAGGAAYVVSRDHALYKVDAATGALRWANADAKWASAPALSPGGDVLYVASRDRRLHALRVDRLDARADAQRDAAALARRFVEAEAH